jgi:hypothetical protein
MTTPNPLSGAQTGEIVDELARRGIEAAELCRQLDISQDELQMLLGRS